MGPKPPRSFLFSFRFFLFSVQATGTRGQLKAKFWPTQPQPHTLRPITHVGRANIHTEPYHLKKPPELLGLCKPVYIYLWVMVPGTCQNNTTLQDKARNRDFFFFCLSLFLSLNTFSHYSLSFLSAPSVSSVLKVYL